MLFWTSREGHNILTHLEVRNEKTKRSVTNKARRDKAARRQLARYGTR